MRTVLTAFFAAAGALALGAGAAAAAAQSVEAPAVGDSSAARVMARVGAQAGAVWLRDFLRQADAPQAQTTLDAVADSLAARAIAPGAADARGAGYGRAVDAVNALILAGSRDPGRGRPYAGAFDRLVSVHRRAPALGVRARALRGLLATPAHGRAVDYVRGVAESSDPTAAYAVDALIADSYGGSAGGAPPTASERQQSAAALAALASAGRVTDVRAAHTLEIWLQRNRAPQPPDPSP